MAGDYAAAEAFYGEVLARDPQQFDALHMLGLIAAQRGRFTEAEARIAAALAINPRSALAHNNFGNVLSEQGRNVDALGEYEAAIAIRPDYADAHSNRGLVLQELGRHEEALPSYRRALELNPGHVEAHYNQGNCLRDLKRLEEATASYDKALLLSPSYADAWSNRGNALIEMGAAKEGVASYAQALAVRPDLPAALNNRGNQLLEEKRYREAAADFARLVSVDPDYPYGPGLLLHARMHCCDWPDYASLVARIETGLRAAQRVCTPFAYQAICTDPALSQKCSQINAEDRERAWPEPMWRGRRYGHKKIRIGYLSGEFRAQATSYLMAGVYDAHDKDKFEIVAFDNGVNDKSATRTRLEKAFARIVDIRRMSDAQAARLIAESEIDILVNLNGYFGHGRNGMFAARSAPVQVNYLGFPGTMGARYMDYLIADKHVIPENEQVFYDEKIVYLPDCYQANDDKRTIGAPATRAAHGLPEEATVYCSFNNSYKLTPQMFDVWMRILRAVEGSVLWLLESNTAMAESVRREAEARGIAGDRIVMAPPIPTEEHLARQSLADLFLDTLPYNAHTTASDALWAGLPVLTCVGTTFPGRVATSLLENVGMGEMVTASLGDYEAAAVRLGRDRAALAALKNRLAENRTHAPLFNTARFTRNLEAAYQRMWARAENGETPESFSVAAA
jgi:predicted O-linked N-acetylglucosamine transferase (SPINDLY family)